MANAKRTSQLGTTTTLQANDRVVVLTNPANTDIANTQTIAVSNFLKQLSLLPGPYVNDTAAGVANVAVLAPYYDTNGVIRLRIA